MTANPPTSDPSLSSGTRLSRAPGSSPTLEIVEVGPRDGLQNEAVTFSTQQKLHLISQLLGAGSKRIEVASFVHPKLVPQMADAEAVVASLPDLKGVTYIGLVLNKRGLLRALETRAGGARGVDEIGAVSVATDGFGLKNQGQTSDESVSASTEIIRLARSEGLSAQVTISTSFGCPFDGAVEAERVVNIVERLSEAEPREIAIADTIGVAVPAQVTDLIGRIRERVPGVVLRAHFHNTRGTGIANAWAAWQAGVHVLDSSLAGLGGCPFAPGATGNIATEDLAYMMARSGIAPHLDIDKLIALAGWVEGVLGRKVPSSLARAGNFTGLPRR